VRLVHVPAEALTGLSPRRCSTTLLPSTDTPIAARTRSFSVPSQRGQSVENASRASRPGRLPSRERHEASPRRRASLWLGRPQDRGARGPACAAPLVGSESPRNAGSQGAHRAPRHGPRCNLRVAGVIMEFENAPPMISRPRRPSILSLASPSTSSRRQYPSHRPTSARTAPPCSGRRGMCTLTSALPPAAARWALHT
jgi:hypothetical protein